MLLLPMQTCVGEGMSTVSWNYVKETLLSFGKSRRDAFYDLKGKKLLKMARGEGIGFVSGRGQHRLQYADPANGEVSES